MCSYDPKTGLYTDRWLWEEIGEEDLSAPFPPPSNEPIVNTSYDPTIPPPEFIPDDLHTEPYKGRRGSLRYPSLATRATEP